MRDARSKSRIVVCGWRALSVTLFVSGLSLALSPSAWHYRKPIQLVSRDSPSAAQLNVVNLDRDIYLAARADLADLRVMRTGEEIPFVIETLDAASQHRQRRARILDQSIAPGVGLQFTLQLDGGFPHNRVHLETDERNFRQLVRVETSENGRSWSTVRDDGAIFDFSQDNRHMFALAVGYPESTRRFLRVTVRGWTKVGALTGASVDFEEQRPASREPLASLTPGIEEDSKTQSTIATIDAGVDGLPVDHIRVATPSQAFHRAVEIETSTNGRDWLYVVQGTLARFPGRPGEDSLVIAVPETRHRYLRLRIYNRDDKPIRIERVELEGLVRRVKFLAEGSGQYWLYYGNPDAAPARYDLPVLLERREHMEQTASIAGPQQMNPAYQPPSAPSRPWSERHPAILYTVLGGAVLGLGAATLRFALRLRQPSTTP